ncbi:hypothetical protein ACF08B_40250 [Streptomyces sp. NPDC015139]|uniref:hypothetical protein n=1 Tax=Streptomyces sp. NPDC015139 TaxID=3364942 RepID=UPI0036FA7CF7
MQLGRIASLPPSGGEPRPPATGSFIGDLPITATDPDGYYGTFTDCTAGDGYGLLGFYAEAEIATPGESPFAAFVTQVADALWAGDLSGTERYCPCRRYWAPQLRQKGSAASVPHASAGRVSAVGSRSRPHNALTTPVSVMCQVVSRASPDRGGVPSAYSARSSNSTAHPRFPHR